VPIVPFEDTGSSVAKEIAAPVEKEPILLHCTGTCSLYRYFENVKVFFAV
jgi:hypothetical protein